MDLNPERRTGGAMNKRLAEIIRQACREPSSDPEWWRTAKNGLVWGDLILLDAASGSAGWVKIPRAVNPIILRNMADVMFSGEMVYVIRHEIDLRILSTMTRQEFAARHALAVLRGVGHVDFVERRGIRSLLEVGGRDKAVFREQMRFTPMIHGFVDPEDVAGLYY